MSKVDFQIRVERMINTSLFITFAHKAKVKKITIGITTCNLKLLLLFTENLNEH